MIYASRKATQKAIRTIITKECPKTSSTRNNSFCTSLECSPLPKRSGKEGIFAKAFKNANGAELIYK
ncbi:MAG: hypothetical protein E7311_03700 [Clostridiales bacterium]|nr:hypothetical protein [Clostridiales bacterium]